jgi:hypothetical protein
MTLAPDAGLVTRKRDLALEYVAQGRCSTTRRSAPRSRDGSSTTRSGDRRVGPPPLTSEWDAVARGAPPGRFGARAPGRADVPRSRQADQPPRRDHRRVARNRLAARPGALIVVTHDRYFLDRVATRISGRSR